MTVVFWTFVFAGFGALLFADLPALAAGLADGAMLASAIGLVLVATVLPYLLYPGSRAARRPSWRVLSRWSRPLSGSLPSASR